MRKWNFLLVFLFLLSIVSGNSGAMINFQRVDAGASELLNKSQLSHLVLNNNLTTYKDKTYRPQPDKQVYFSVESKAYFNKVYFDKKYIRTIKHISQSQRV